jgi:hypothetical protein
MPEDVEPQTLNTLIFVFANTGDLAALEEGLDGLLYL